jgi:MoaA/NifB/PqqE/SkfB family radical SAM enzyme
MIHLDDVREVHLELSTNCNASCPLCPRTFFGYPHNSGYPITELSLTDIQNIFGNARGTESWYPDILTQLDEIKINGNLGDFMLARDSLEIIEYFRAHNPRLHIRIHTNGGARNAEFWTRLAASSPVVCFALDGFEDTHSLYRKDTKFETVLTNAKTFIAAGGIAIWKMIKFSHNEHQIEDARALSQELGFYKFELVDHGRDTGPVFDRHGKFAYSIGNKTPDIKENVMVYMDHKRTHAKKGLHEAVKPTRVCYTQGRRSIYISAAGDVYPCCFMGFFPKTYDSELYAGNNQIKEMIGEFNNNTLQRPLIECLEWFNKIEIAWQQDSIAKGYPYVCNLHCGQ